MLRSFVVRLGSTARGRKIPFEMTMKKYKASSSQMGVPQRKRGCSEDLESQRASRYYRRGRQRYDRTTFRKNDNRARSRAKAYWERIWDVGVQRVASEIRLYRLATRITTTRH
ncbi:hypothetical protein VTN96DRAFT_8512 [Rasamsonia emersonii]